MGNLHTPKSSHADKKVQTPTDTIVNDPPIRICLKGFSDVLKRKTKRNYPKLTEF